VAFAPLVKLNYITVSKQAKGTGVILIVIVGLLNFHPHFCLNLLNISDGLDDALRDGAIFMKMKWHPKR
jgi:hypothetical protein